MKTTTPPGPIDAALRQAVRASGLSLRALAVKAGVPAPALSRWLAGRRRGVSLITADRLAVFLNLELRPRGVRG
jgi:transcriptional regulator with XRE-family HTH domain